MNRAAALLMVSLVLNAVLLVLLWRGPVGAAVTRQDAPAAAVRTIPRPQPSVSGRAPTLDLHSTTQLRELVESMRVAGYSTAVIRESIKKIVGRQADRQRIAWMYPPDAPFWRQGVRAHDGAERASALAKITVEQLKQTREVLGDLAVDVDSPRNQLAWERRLGKAIPKAKYDEILRLSDDSMLLAYEAGPGGPSARDVEMALQAEIARLLTPAELAEFELRYSKLTGQLKSLTSGIELSEAQFRRLYEGFRTQGEGGDVSRGLSANPQFLQEALGILGEAGFMRATGMLDPQSRRIFEQSRRDRIAPEDAIRILAITRSHLQAREQVAADSLLDGNARSLALLQLDSDAQTALSKFVPAGRTSEYLPVPGR